MSWGKRLNVLLLTIVAFESSQASATASCPSRCTCTRRIVNCARKALRNIPDDIPPTTTVLYLGYNQITGIPDWEFGNLTQLKILSLKNNLLNSESVGENAFRGLKSLKELYLTGNKLSQLKRDIFVDLTALKWLYLTQNKMTAIPDLSYCKNLTKFGIDNNQLNSARFPKGFANLTYLSTVVLSNNNITALGYDDVKSLHTSSIRSINLARCGLRSLNSSIFAMFPHLQSLDLSYNALDAELVRAVIRELSTSAIVSLELCGIDDKSLTADLFANYSAVPLATLNLANSHITSIKNGTFTSLKRLKILDISRSGIVYIEDDAFGDIGVNMTLKLNNNRLETVPGKLPRSLQVLHLSHNQIGIIQESQFVGLGNLQELCLASCNINKMKNGVFDGLNKLTYLDLSNNVFGGSNIGNKVLQPLINLKFLSLKGNSMSTIPTQRKMFQSLSELVELDMSDNNCKYIAPGLLSPLKSLKRLDLSGNDLGAYVDKQDNLLFANLTNLEQLTMKNCQLYKLPMMLFHGLTSLKTLYLPNNKISEWERGLFTKNRFLKDVNLSDNEIAVINETSVEGLPAGVILELTGNPFSCWCDLIWFRNWIDQLANTSEVSLPGNTSYQCHSPRSMVGKSVLDFRPVSIHDQCFPPPWTEIIVSVVVGVVIAFIVAGAVVYRYRWSIRLRWYWTKKWLASCGRQRPGYEQLGDGVQYDVCILYGQENEDVQWVTSVLVQKLDKEEGGKWTVFFKDKSILPNQNPIGKTWDALNSSMRIIIVLTSSYIRQRRGLFEISIAFEAAHMKNESSVNVIIPVLLDDQALQNLPSLLNPWFENDKHLSWPNNSDGQALFWEKLFARLPRPENDQN